MSSPSAYRDRRTNTSDNHDRGRKLPDGIAWAHSTPRFQALGFGFSIQTTQGALGSYLQELLAPLSAPGEPEHVYSFIGQRDRGPYEVYRDGELVTRATHPSTALRDLLWDVNHSVVQTTTDLLLVHASGAEHSGRVIVLPGVAGAGKSTLVAGLVQAGLRYVTDEAVAIEPDSLEVQPYPKPLAIDPGSWSVLPGLRPVLGSELPPLMEAAWYVAPTTIRDDAVARACPPRFVIAPMYERGARTRLEGMKRSDALLTLAESSFNIPRIGARRAMDVLARVVRGCRCFRLTMGDLDPACELVLELLREAPAEEISA